MKVLTQASIAPPEASRLEPAIEAEPADPEHGSTDHRSASSNAEPSFLAEAGALADHDRAHQTGEPALM
jgi:hypothetical protein